MMSAGDLEQRLTEREEEITRLQEELEETNKGVLALYSELEAQAKRLRDADARKDDFLAMLGHELRNPLAAATMAAENLEEVRGVRDSPAARRSHEVIRHQLDRLKRLVDDLLDVSRISRGKVTIEKTGIDLRACLEEVVDAMRPGVEAAGHRLDVDLPSQPMPMLGDAARLEQMVSNLLDNARKYTPAPGHIRLRCGPEEGGARLDVADDGRGLPPREIDDMFEAFVQRSGPRGRVLEGGLGLGLSLVKGVAELHGGRAWAESEGLGQGSCFSVWLPTIASTRGKPAAPRRATPRSPAAPRPLKILLVEDNEDFRDLLGVGLERRGYAVREAGNAAEALAVAEVNPIDVAVLDLGLPDLDGRALGLRLVERLEPKPVLIALSGFGSPEDQRRSLEAGFGRHLVKPVSLEQLEATIRDLLASDTREG